MEDATVFGRMNHELLVIGAVGEGFRLWCRRCDLMGRQLHDDFTTAWLHAATLKKDIAPECASKERAA